MDNLIISINNKREIEILDPQTHAILCKANAAEVKRAVENYQELVERVRFLQNLLNDYVLPPDIRIRPDFGFEQNELVSEKTHELLEKCKLLTSGGAHE